MSTTTLSASDRFLVKVEETIPPLPPLIPYHLFLKSQRSQQVEDVCKESDVRPRKRKEPCTPEERSLSKKDHCREAQAQAQALNMSKINHLLTKLVGEESEELVSEESVCQQEEAQRTFWLDWLQVKAQQSNLCTVARLEISS